MLDDRDLRTDGRNLIQISPQKRLEQIIGLLLWQRDYRSRLMYSAFTRNSLTFFLLINRNGAGALLVVFRGRLFQRTPLLSSSHPSPLPSSPPFSSPLLPSSPLLFPSALLLSPPLFPPALLLFPSLCYWAEGGQTRLSATLLFHTSAGGANPALLALL